MKFTLLFALVYQLVSRASPNDSFEIKQKSFLRVAVAYEHCEKGIQQKLKKKGLVEYSPIFIRVYKKEKLLQLWVQKKDTFVKYGDFKICAASGILGPKRKQGDNQVPEGFYYIQVFNPLSLYHLSLGINYPNESDKIISTASDIGGDIYIHGECASIGCMAMDTSIEEMYVLAVKAKAGGQEQIPVHIFPFRMTEKNMEQQIKLTSNKKLLSFWGSLKHGFSYFEKKKKLSTISIDEKGRYLIDE